VQNNLSVPPQQFRRQISTAVCRKTHAITEQRVPYLFLPIRAVDTIADCIVAVIVGVNLAGRDYRNISGPGPGHHPADTGQNPPAVPYTRITASQKKISLRIDIYDDVPATPFKQLPNHFSDSLLTPLLFGPIIRTLRPAVGSPPPFCFAKRSSGGPKLLIE
jgi:hypothetical protein